MGDIVNFEGGKWCGWNPWSFRLELEAKIDAKRLALDEGVVEEDPELFLVEGKTIGNFDDWSDKECLEDLVENWSFFRIQFYSKHSRKYDSLCWSLLNLF